MQAHFDLAMTKELIRQNRYAITRKGSSWLINHDFDAEEVIRQVILELESTELFKVYPPKTPEGSWADAYHYRGRTEGFDEGLYVKFTVEEESGLLVVVLSCKEWNYGW
jgi:hypothetical protein